MNLPEPDLVAILQAGDWGPTAEDSSDFYGEQIPAQWVKQWVEQYDPHKIESTAGLGALTLITAAAAWGVTPGGLLPEDPEGKQWKGAQRGNDGKHLMSYAVGGVGVDHTDSAQLKRLFDFIKLNHLTLAPKADQFFNLRGINFDNIRARGGVCSTPRSEITLDLDAKPFAHDIYGGGSSYCGAHMNGATTLEDWQIFRHWIRTALRQKDVQSFIINQWLTNVWVPSYQAVLAAGGSVEEAMINSRIRNSSPVTAKCAIDKANQVADGKRIETQLKAYTDPDCKGKARHSERFGVMKRPMVLYRHFRQQP
ncbi:hypothetical protein [Pseudomonas sp. OV226]|uniref:hypothetical protein n=1 Tax=Pseudomonas sp. OV226 TaxID=2135588 RepID=UPI000D6C6C80|nr:hypothetical protein [Pseudomonas sp. OV226]PWK45519.1 hypothetical protein C7534_101105 [Pseudomonas sp. OV226]